MELIHIIIAIAITLGFIVGGYVCYQHIKRIVREEQEAEVRALHRLDIECHSHCQDPCTEYCYGMTATDPKTENPQLWI